MNEKFFQIIIATMLLVVLIGMFYSPGDKQIIVSSDAVNKISVSGEAETEVMPDEVVMTLSVVTEGKEADSVQDENTENMNNAIEALKKAGVKEDEIETTGYNLHPWKEYDYQLKKQIDKGYRLTQKITLTTTEVDKTGEYLKVAVNNGINKVGNINFQLTDKLEKQVKNALVAEATKNAKDKAKTLASNLDVSVGKPISITEQSYSVPRYYAGGFDTAEMAMDEAAVAPKINAENVEVSIRIGVEFKIE